MLHEKAGKEKLQASAMYPGESSSSASAMAIGAQADICYSQNTEESSFRGEQAHRASASIASAKQLHLFYREVRRKQFQGVSNGNGGRVCMTWASLVRL